MNNLTIRGQCIPHGTSTCCYLNCRFFFIFFYPQKEKGLFQHTVENEVSASSMMTFYKNQLLIGQEGSSLECLESDTRTPPTLASTHA